MIAFVPEKRVATTFFPMTLKIAISFTLALLEEIVNSLFVIGFGYAVKPKTAFSSKVSAALFADPGVP
jgi:hypothetical protein